MTMPRRVTVPIWALLGVAALGGCRDRVKEISSSRHLLDHQHKLWARAEETLRSDSPNLEFFRALQPYINARTRRRVLKDYTASDRQQLLDKLDAVKEAYNARIVSLLDMGANVRLRGGVTMEQLREAFRAVDGEYRGLKAMTTPE